MHTRLSNVFDTFSRGPLHQGSISNTGSLTILPVKELESDVP